MIIDITELRSDRARVNSLLSQLCSRPDWCPAHWPPATTSPAGAVGAQTPSLRCKCACEWTFWKEKVQYVSWTFKISVLFMIYLLYLFIERKEGGRRRGRETLMCKKNINRLPLTHAQQRTWPTTQACALIRNWTSDQEGRHSPPGLWGQLPTHWSTLVRTKHLHFPMTRRDCVEEWPFW